MSHSTRDDLKGPLYVFQMRVQQILGFKHLKAQSQYLGSFPETHAPETLGYHGEPKID